MTEIMITHVYLVRGVVTGWITTDKGKVHYLGHTPYGGWFCTCGRGKRCPQIDKIKELVPVSAVEEGGRLVRERIVPAGACVGAASGRHE